jgi:hypothetical protein
MKAPSVAAKTTMGVRPSARRERRKPGRATMQITATALTAGPDG